jgi:hypothetical protein
VLISRSMIAQAENNRWSELLTSSLIVKNDGLILARPAGRVYPAM